MLSGRAFVSSDPVTAVSASVSASVSVIVSAADVSSGMLSFFGLSGVVVVGHIT